MRRHLLCRIRLPWRRKPRPRFPCFSWNRPVSRRLRMRYMKAIRELASSGLLDGVTTNPSLIARSGRGFIEVVKEICSVVEGPVSAEVTALDSAGMIKEGEKLARIAKNIAIKVPLTWDGLK